MRVGVGRTTVVLLVGILVASVAALIMTGAIDTIVGEVAGAVMGIAGEVGGVTVPSLGDGGEGIIPLLLARRR